MRPARPAAALACLAALSLGAPATAQPTNDPCSAAAFLPLTGASPATAAGTLVGATSDVAETCPVFDSDPFDVWHRITAPVSGPYLIDTFGSVADTTLSVWDAPCDGLVPGDWIACNDDFDIFPDSAVVANLTAGQAYLIRIATYPNFQAPYSLTVNFPSGSIAGACCAGGSCAVGPAGGCAGTFQGAGTACGPTTCPAVSGVCCRGSVCATVAGSDACTPTGAAGAQFLAAGACNPPGGTRAPCCFADYNKAGNVELLDIFDFLTDWFAGSTLTNHNGDAQAPDLLDIFSFLEDWFAGPCA